MSFYVDYLKVGDVLTIGEILKNKQPNVYYVLIFLSKDFNINYKKLMEDAPVYIRYNGALRQVRQANEHS